MTIRRDSEDIYIIEMDENGDGMLIAREFKTKEEAWVHFSNLVNPSRAIRYRIYKNGHPIDMDQIMPKNNIG